MRLNDQIKSEIARVYRLGEPAACIALQLHCCVPTIYRVLHERTPEEINRKQRARFSTPKPLKEPFHHVCPPPHVAAGAFKDIEQAKRRMMAGR